MGSKYFTLQEIMRYLPQESMPSNVWKSQFCVFGIMKF